MAGLEGPREGDLHRCFVEGPTTDEVVLALGVEPSTRFPGRREDEREDAAQRAAELIAEHTRQGTPYAGPNYRGVQL